MQFRFVKHYFLILVQFIFFQKSTFANETNFELALQEAQKVESEILKKIKINHLAHKNYFGKFISVYSKYQKQVDPIEKLNCAKYEIKAILKSSLSQSYFVKETCEKNNSKEVIKFTITKDKIEIEFYTQALGGVIGLSASLLNKKATCSVVLIPQDSSSKALSQNSAQSSVANRGLKSFKCQDLVYTKSTTEVLHIKSINYKKDQDPLIIIDGMWIEDFNEEKSMKVTVPITGAIKIVETQVRKLIPVQTQKPNPVVNSVVTEQPKGPDQIQTTGQEAIPLDANGQPEVKLQSQPQHVNPEFVDPDMTIQQFQEQNLDPNEVSVESEPEMGAQDPRTIRGRKNKSNTQSSDAFQTPELPQMQNQEGRMQSTPVDANGQPIDSLNGSGD